MLYRISWKCEPNYYNVTTTIFWIWILTLFLFFFTSSFCINLSHGYVFWQKLLFGMTYELIVIKTGIIWQFREVNVCWFWLIQLYSPFLRPLDDFIKRFFQLNVDLFYIVSDHHHYWSISESGYSDILWLEDILCVY